MKKFLLQMWRMLSVGLESFDLNQRRRNQRMDAVIKDMDAWRKPSAVHWANKIKKREALTWNW